MRLSEECKRTLLEQLEHNGVIVPDPPPYHGLSIRIRGQSAQMTPKQEEMALAWAKKQGTPYVTDPVFVDNFMRDFSLALGVDETLSVDEVDLSSAIRVVEAEREAKARMTREDRTAQAAVRKAIRQELKERYGHAIVNGNRVELGNYMTEPSGIFMGRGEHPLRGRWKEGATQQDVTLNLSPESPRPEGDWGEIVWQPDSLWVARWEDRLSGKLKYIWLSDTAPVKQEREALKFDKAIELSESLGEVREHIQQGLRASDPRQRMIAMACYLIDALCLRVGDEKEADEADTVGATTLRPEHVTLHPDGRAEFQFLGKDSVAWHKSLDLPPQVCSTLEELIRAARPSSSAGNGNGFHPTRDLPQLFPDIHSRNVNAFLSRAQEGLSAKVFRTHHATMAVQRSLAESGVSENDPEYVKWHAVVRSNLEAAILCNHTKQYNGNWESTRQRYQDRLDKAEARRERCVAHVAEQEEKLQLLIVEATTRRAIERAQVEKIDPSNEARLKRAKLDLERVKARYDKRVAAARKRVEDSREPLRRAEAAIGKIRAQYKVADHKRTWNLGTSLKSYIDPRVYHRWGQTVGYDVIEEYYPKALRRKFAWVRTDGSEADEDVDADGDTE